MLGDERRARAGAATALVDAANDGGGPDNITALVLQVDAP